MGISIGWYYFENTVVNGKKGYIKSSTTQVENKNILFSFLLVHAIGNGSSCGLVDDPHDNEAGDGSGIFCSLTLGIIEIL